jgi:endonuclease/exonuclease/phosphatase family metal-dependent hydrolase
MTLWVETIMKANYLPNDAHQAHLGAVETARLSTITAILEKALRVEQKEHPTVEDFNPVPAIKCKGILNAVRRTRRRAYTPQNLSP